MDKLIIGCGYLGRRVAAFWHEQGHRVFATTRRIEGATELRALDYEPVVCDVLDPDSLRSLPRVHSVVYAIGLDRSSGQTMRDVYVRGLANVLDAMPAPDRFIYVSSSSVYGQTAGEWVDESSATEPQEDSGKIVLEAEAMLRSRRPDAILLRFAGIYGPDRLLRSKSIRAGEPIVGDAGKWLNLIHVEDGTHAILSAETLATPSGIYNICDDQPVRRRDFYTELAKLLTAPAPSFVLPWPSQAPPHEKGNRRISNRRMKEDLHVLLHYPHYRAGLKASVPV
jgi:nucleoside-diphosphate-sugar epimerase